jgi:hypothetical protein
MRKNLGSILVGVVLIIFTIVIITLASGYPYRARLFPLVFAVPVLVMAIIQLLYDLPNPRFKKWFSFVSDTGVKLHDSQDEHENGDAVEGEKQIEGGAENSMAAFPMIRMFLWLVLLAYGLSYFGLISVLVYMFVMSKFEARQTWVKSCALSAGTWLCLYLLFDVFLSLDI